ncbi:MAG: ABC transporter substrate-binding protein [Deltaproteobacteria bacterium]|nr:ABC transporter substrate-binding protein [Deltaproteobacteria bacterium]MBI3077724.1 ABC transporter substrate-binding protein [Deltaproteobacteria bacterium]
MTKTGRRVSWGVGLAALALMAIPVSAPGASPRLHLGIVTLSASHLPIWGTEDGGYFPQEGVDVQSIVIGGSATALQSLLAGDVALVTVAGPAVVNAKLRGADLVMIAGLVTFPPYEVVVRPDIARVEELRGKALAVNRFGGAADFLLRHLLRQHGMNPDRDVKILQVGGQTERVAALGQGTVAGTAVDAPFTTKARRFGVRTLVDLTKSGIAFQHTGLSGLGRTLQADRDRVRRLMRAVARGIHRIKTDREFAIRSVVRHLRLERPDEAVEAVELFAPKLPAAPYPTLQGLQFILDSLAEKSPRARAVSPEALTDLSFVRELEESGFIRRLYARPAGPR